ncbi:MAG TPA: hypothetical protein P5102_13545 [Candidatus Competibacteraceae bacterium]|nr:hypothetical protein [Candidatus Competibacteraceae bacterium]
MKFKLNKIAAAMAVGLGTSVVGMNVAQADAILFPNMVTSDAVTTILSVINNDDRTSVKTLHYRYYYKADPAPTSACEETNYLQPTSPNDIVTFDIGGVFGDSKAVLFEPARAKAVYDKDFAVFRNLKPVRAIGLIDNTAAGFVPGADLAGEAFIIEFSQGAVWGYDAYNPAAILGSTDGVIAPALPFDFSDRVENNGEVLVQPFSGSSPNPDSYWVPTAVMPWSGDIQTALFVTPVTTDMLVDNQNNFLTVGVTLAVDDPANIGLDVMYDRDENPFSGRRSVAVTCVARVELKDLVTVATRQFLQDSGGWTHIIVGTPAVAARRNVGQAIVMKLEYNDKAPADLDGKPTGSASWNNAIWLRKGFRESLDRIPFPGAPNGVVYLPAFDIAVGDDLNAPYPLVDTKLAASAKLPWPPAYGADPTPYARFAAVSVKQ